MFNLKNGTERNFCKLLLLRLNMIDKLSLLDLIEEHKYMTLNEMSFKLQINDRTLSSIMKNNYKHSSYYNMKIIEYEDNLYDSSIYQFKDESNLDTYLLRILDFGELGLTKQKSLDELRDDINKNFKKYFDYDNKSKFKTSYEDFLEQVREFIN